MDQVGPSDSVRVVFWSSCVFSKHQLNINYSHNRAFIHSASIPDKLIMCVCEIILGTCCASNKH